MVERLHCKAVSDPNQGDLEIQIYMTTATPIVSIPTKITTVLGLLGHGKKQDRTFDSETD